MTAVQHSSYMMIRYMRALARQPAWIFVTLVQPVIWLLLFGALFERTVDIPGFASDSYIEFLAPGVVVMTAFFSAGWTGMGMIQDYDRGILDRFLSSPVKRIALIAGPLMQNALVILVQSVIIVALALILGASFPNGVLGVVALIVISSLLGAGFGALSNGLALVFLKEESLIATMVFLQLPLTFLSGAFMQESLQPEWMQVVADFNPVNWAIEAGRNVAMEELDWSLVLSRTGLLIAFVVAAGVTATSPTTMPVAAPTAVALPVRRRSSRVQTTRVAAGASNVLAKASAAEASAARAEPALKPNQPNQSIPAPSRVNGTLCGKIACRAKSLRGFKTRAVTRAAAAALMWTTVPPAKSSAPIFASHPPPQTQCATGA